MGQDVSRASEERETAKESRANERPSAAFRAIAIVVLLLIGLFVLSVAYAAIRGVSDGVSASDIGVGAAMIALVTVAVVVHAREERPSWKSRVAEIWNAVAPRLVIAYAALLVMLLYAVVLLVAFSPGLNLWVVDQTPVMQALILAALGAMVFVFLRRLLNRKRRQGLINSLMDAPLGVLGAPAFLVLAASVALTASSALLLVGADHGWWEMHAASGLTDSRVVDADELATGTLTSKLVLWEMLDMIPVIEVPRTLVWDEPLGYDDWGPGVVLLAFKGIAGVALIAAGKSVFDAWDGRDARRMRAATEPPRGMIS